MQVITVVENNLNMLWNVHSYLENLQQLHWSDKTVVLIYRKPGTQLIPEWDIVKSIYPEVNYIDYEGDILLKNIVSSYISVIRPYCLKFYWREYPELEHETIVYTDSDILFTSTKEIETLFEDNITYMSSTLIPSDYMSHEYLEGKLKDVKKGKEQAFKVFSPTKRFAEMHGITEQQVIDNKENTGGVQYILKGITEEFWQKVLIDCFTLRVDMMNTNQILFPGKTPMDRENKGFQSWASDLWSVMYNLIYFNLPFKTSPLLDFAWATDKVERLNNCYILHNAGVTSDSILRTTQKDVLGKHIEIDAPAFYKNKYSHNKYSPFKDLEYIRKVVENPISLQYCTSIYAKHLLDIQKKYNINY